MSYYQEMIDMKGMVNKPQSGMVDVTYFDGSRLSACKSFLDDLENMVLNKGYEVNPVINNMDFALDIDILYSLRSFCPSEEKFLLFWTNKTTYNDKGDFYEIYYPVHKEITEHTKKYEISKSDMTLFIFCKMYTKQAEEGLYSRMKAMKVTMPYVLPVPPSYNSIEKDGQMKILTDFIEIVQDIEFEENDKVLIIGSSSQDGVCAGKSYNILSYMTDKKVSVDLRDPNDVTCSYDIGSVTYNHVASNYNFKGGEMQYKLIIDDAWIEKCDRQWDRDNDYAKAEYFSIKWFPYYKICHQHPRGKRKKQRYRTEAFEERLTSHLPLVEFRQEDRLGKCQKCVALKYILHKEYDLEFYNYIMRMHSIHCVTKERRAFFGEICDMGNQKWYEAKNYIVDPQQSYCCKWDKIEGHRVIYPDAKRNRGLQLIFTNRNNVRPDLYMLSLCVVFENETIYINRENVPYCEYVSQEMECLDMTSLYNSVSRESSDVKRKKKKYNNKNKSKKIR